MHLGWLDTCIRVADVRQSRAFYEALGFVRAEGDDGEGWAVMVSGYSRIGLFEPKFMSTPFSLNFRGGDVMAIGQAIQQKGIAFESGPTPGAKGGASASLRDPDGNMVFFDCAPDEVKPVP